MGVTESLSELANPDERAWVDVAQKDSSGASRCGALIVAVVIPAMYLVYVVRYSVNGLVLDTWTRIPLLHSARHGHLTWGALWAQYNETRIFLGNVIFVVFGQFDHFNVRAIVLFNASLFVVTFWLFLLLVRNYVGHRLGPLPVLVIGVVWFSLADLENNLWGFQVHWFLVTFFFVAMSYLLLVPASHRNLAFAFAGLAAVAASCSMIQGFILWIVGLICLVWRPRWTRRTFCEIGVWIGLAGLTAALYSIGFDTQGPGCPPGGCGAAIVLHYPMRIVQFFLVLVGNVFPHGSIGFHEVLGAAILAAAAYVVAQSLRERPARQQPPVPILLITYGVMFDLMIASGRFFWGPLAALTTRYVMPGLMLLLGITVYLVAHLPDRRPAVDENSARAGMRRIALVVFGVLLLAQVIGATTFGLHDGLLSKQANTYQALLFANFDRVPKDLQGCELSTIMYYHLIGPEASLQSGLPLIDEAKSDHMSMFETGSYRALRREGLPKLGCHPNTVSTATR